MRTAIVAGVPLGQLQRLERALTKTTEALGDAPLWRPGWHVHWAHLGDRTRVGVTTAQAEALVRTATAASTPTHVYVFRSGHATAAVQAAVHHILTPYVRFAWLDPRLLQLFQDVPALVERLNALLATEQQWVDDVSPAAIAHPLLVPEPCFLANAQSRHMWSLAAHANNPDDIRGARNALDQFTAHHRHTHSQRAVWIDTRGHVFDEHGPRHGNPAPPFTHKHSFPLGAFHFDVTCERRRPFVLRDAEGVSHTVAAGAHLNIDAHGRQTHGR